MKILGVHPVDGVDECFMIEAEIDEAADYDWGAVTQEDPDQPRANWQVAWDERPLDPMERRWAFFIHFLQLDRPLLTPEGPIVLPTPTPVPDHLRHVQYETP